MGISAKRLVGPLRGGRDLLRSVKLRRDPGAPLQCQGRRSQSRSQFPAARRSRASLAGSGRSVTAAMPAQPWKDSEGSPCAPFRRTARTGILAEPGLAGQPQLVFPSARAAGMEGWGAVGSGRARCPCRSRCPAPARCLGPIPGMGDPLCGGGPGDAGGAAAGAAAWARGDAPAARRGAAERRGEPALHGQRGRR